MNATEKAAMWQRINALLVEHERAQTDAVRLALADSWDALRQKLTVVALESGEPTSGAKE